LGRIAAFRLSPSGVTLWLDGVAGEAGVLRWARGSVLRSRATPPTSRFANCSTVPKSTSTRTSAAA